MQSKFTKSANKSKKNFYYKIQYGYQKTQNFTLISNPLKKFWKNAPTKSISKNVTEICPFSLFTYVCQTCFAYNFFFVNFFPTFSTDSKSAWNSGFFVIYLDFFPKKNFGGHISTFWKLWSQTRKETAQKIKKRI